MNNRRRRHAKRRRADARFADQIDQLCTADTRRMFPESNQGAARARWDAEIARRFRVPLAMIARPGDPPTGDR